MAAKEQPRKAVAYFPFLPVLGQEEQLQGDGGLRQEVAEQLQPSLDEVGASVVGHVPHGSLPNVFETLHCFQDPKKRRIHIQVQMMRYM